MGLFDIVKRIGSGVLDTGLSAYDKYRDFKDQYKDIVPPDARKYLKHKGRQAVGGLAAAFRPEDSKYVDEYRGPRRPRPIYDQYGRYGNYGGGGRGGGRNYYQPKYRDDYDDYDDRYRKPSYGRKR
jgi:hypothetical protein